VLGESQQEGEEAVGGLRATHGGPGWQVGASGSAARWPAAGQSRGRGEAEEEEEPGGGGARG
jgi:hypothetical protein